MCKKIDLTPYLPEFFNDRWAYKSNYLDTLQIKQKSKQEQFALFLKTLNTLEQDLALLGIKGGAMYWTNIKAGRWGINEHARELFNAFARGGAREYHKTLNTLRDKFAKHRSLQELGGDLATDIENPYPKPALRPGQVAYDTRVMGAWNRGFYLVMTRAAYGSVLTGWFDQSVAWEDETSEADTETEGEDSVPLNSARVYFRAEDVNIKKEVVGTVTVKVEVGFNPVEDAPIIQEAVGQFKGRFEVKDRLPTFSGDWNVTVKGITYAGTWFAALQR